MISLWLIVGVCCVLPLAWMIWQVGGQKQVLFELRPTSFRMRLLGRTLLYNGAAALLATVMALPAAVVVGRGRGWGARTLIFLLPVVLVMPSITFTYGWLQFFRLVHVAFVPAEWPDILRCIWTLAAWIWPLPAIVIGLALRFSDSQVQQQAILDGAKWRITLRQMAGPMLAGLAISGVLAMQEFGVYERSGISVIATEVRTVFETGAMSENDPSAISGVTGGMGRLYEGQAGRAAAAVATSLPLLGIVAILTLLAFWGAGRLSLAEGVDPENWPRILDAGLMAHVLSWLALIVSALVPAAAMIMSLARPWSSMRVWAWTQPYVTGSLLYGGLSGIVALVLAMLACVRRSRGLLLAALAIYLIGGELLAIADIRIYNRAAPWPLSSARVSGHDLFGWIYNNVPVMVMAYVGRFGWLALLAGSVSWSASFRGLRDLSAVDGAGAWRTALHVIWPIAWPILLASAVLVVILSMTEVSASVLLSPQRPQMLIPTLMGWVHMLRYDDMLEGSLMLMGMVFLLGIGFVILIWAGARLAGAARRWPILPAILAAILLVGCDDGKHPEAVWFESGADVGQLAYPRGIAFSKRDRCFFVVDRTARIQRFDTDGHVSAMWRMPKWDNGKPVGLSVGPDGNLYVADTHYARVVVFSPTGQYIREWGSAGREPGQFVYPTDVAFDSAGDIYVSEYGDNDRIQVFDPTGSRVLRTIGRFGQGDGEFARPQSMVIEGDRIYVTDSCNHRIAVFRTDGTFVRNMGGIGSELGHFRFPYGLEEDPQGRLVVTEFGNNRVQLVDKETGQGLKTWGAAGREEGQLAYPWAAAVDNRGRVVVVDSGNNRLQVFHW